MNHPDGWYRFEDFYRSEAPAPNHAYVICRVHNEMLEASRTCLTCTWESRKVAEFSLSLLRAETDYAEPDPVLVPVRRPRKARKAQPRKEAA